MELFPEILRSHEHELLHSIIQDETIRERGSSEDDAQQGEKTWQPSGSEDSVHGHSGSNSRKDLAPLSIAKPKEGYRGSEAD